MESTVHDLSAFFQDLLSGRKRHGRQVPIGRVRSSEHFPLAPMDLGAHMLCSVMPGRTAVKRCHPSPAAENPN